MLEAMRTLLDQVVVRVVEDDTADHNGPRTVLEHGPVPVEDGTHAGRIEEHILGSGLNLTRLNGGVMEKLDDTALHALMGLRLGRPGRLGDLAIDDCDLAHLAHTLEQLLGAADGQTEARHGPGQGDTAGMFLGIENDIQPVTGHVDTSEGDIFLLQDLGAALGQSDMSFGEGPEIRVQVHLDAQMLSPEHAANLIA